LTGRCRRQGVVHNQALTASTARVHLLPDRTRLSQHTPPDNDGETVAFYIFCNAAVDQTGV
jgi:hypothetical protein